MKPVSQVTACVADYGTFISLAEKLGETMNKVYYYSPFETEYLDLQKCVKGSGLPNIERLDEPLDPERVSEIDLYVYPDIGMGGQQRFLRSLGKKVWGSFGACELELYRTLFLKVIKRLGLPVVKSETIVGLTSLSEHLKHCKDKWIKVNRFRENMETWHHIDYDHSKRKLESLAVTFGPFKERVVFVVQDAIPDAREIGYDGWFTNGEFPPGCFQGYEKKNQLYLGSRRDWNQLPEAVQAVNEAIAPELEKYGYCNFWATEIRWLSDDDFYFIDPTARTPGQTGEQNFETIGNLADLIWQAANGKNIEPEFVADFSAAATLHYTDASPDEWKSFRIPEEVRQWVKPYHCAGEDGMLHVPPAKNDEVGVLLGIGDTAEKAIDALQDHANMLEDEPLKIEMSGFVDLLKDIQEAEKEGMEFSDKPMPEPQTALNL